MDNKKISVLGSFTGLIDYFYCFFIGNLYFLLLNLPILTLLFFALPPRSVSPSMVTLFMCLLPIGPSLTALLYAMDKLVRNKDTHVTKNFFKSYKLNFKQAMIIWSIELIVIMILSINITRTASAFSYVQMIMLLIVFLMTFYAFPILSRFHTNVKAIILLSFYSVFRNIKNTLLVVMMVFSAIYFLSLIPSMAMLIVFSGLSYLIMGIQKNYLEGLDS